MLELRLQIGSTEMYLCDRWSLSADGDILFMEHREDALAGQLTVLNRVE